MSTPVMNCLGRAFLVFPASLWSALRGAGVYLLCRREANGTATILYTGQTGELLNYIGPGHRKWQGALAQGMNEIHVHYLAGERARLDLETEIRHEYPSDLNEQGPATQGMGLLGAFAAPPPPENYLAPFSFVPPWNAMAQARDSLLPEPDPAIPRNAMLAALLRGR